MKDIPQNTNPWVTLNMRSILDNGEVSRGKEGTPWSDFWHKIIKLCDGFDAKPTQIASNSTVEFNLSHGWEKWVDAELKKVQALPCRETTVVYGHAAARGLDIKRWSKG